MNLFDMSVEVQRLTGRNDSNFTSRIHASLNRALRQWARALPWPALKQVREISHIGGRELVLPGDVERLVWLVDKTNQSAVEASSNWDRSAPSNLSADTPGAAVAWEDAGCGPTWTGVTGPLSVISSSVTDTASIYIYGDVQHATAPTAFGLYGMGEVLTLANASGVTSTHSYSKVSAISKSADTLAHVTVMCASSPVAILAPYERETRYPKIRLLDIPTNQPTFIYGAFIQPQPLVHLYQAPSPSVETDFLIWAAAHDIFWQTKEGQRADKAWAMAEQIARHKMGVERAWGDQGVRFIPEDYRS